MEYGSTQLPERFWKNVIPEPNSGCWLWLGAQNNKGYGNFYFGSKKVSTHRLISTLAHGEPRSWHETRHRCDTPICCNPDHLRWGSHRENMRDSKNRGRNHQKSKTHCPKGHEYNKENTRYNKKGWRYCRPCKRKPS